MVTSKLLFKDTLHVETLYTTTQKSFVLDEIYALLNRTYKDIKGGLHFSSSDELLIDTSIWKVIYSDAEIIGVIIYKAKKGLKMVAVALSNHYSKYYHNIAKSFLSYVFKLTFSHTWMELSEGAERFILKNGGDKYVLPNSLASKLTEKDIVELCEDGYHYKRLIKGVLKTKILVGTPKNIYM